MKRFLFIIFIAILSLYPLNNAYSAPLTFQFETGILSRDIVEVDAAGNKIGADATSTRILARFGFRPSDRLELYAQVGGADLEVPYFDEYDGDISFAYGAGVKIILYESPTPEKTQLFMDANILTFTTDDRVRHVEPDTGEIFVGDEEITWIEYVIAAGASVRHFNYRPYGGVRISFVDGDDHFSSPTLISDLNFEEDNILGVFLGTDIFFSPSEATALNIEGALFDEYSIRIGVKILF